MKQTKNPIAIGIIALLFTACQKDARLISISEKKELANSQLNQTLNSKEGDDGGGSGLGHVYTLGNQTSGNKVLAYRRAGDGMLSLEATYPTGGTGTGNGLGSQGAVIIGDEGEILLAVNPGSNSISSFEVNNHGLNLRSTVPSGGQRPVSITLHDNLVFVLNAGGDGNISGFRLGDEGRLVSIPHSTRPLSAKNAGAAQIEFINDGKVLAITEKATNKITTYTVNEWGIPGAMHTLTSANTTPFGFAPGQNGNIFVSEAAGGAPGASTLTSYHISNNGAIALVNSPVGANQSAACWVVIADNGRFAYTTNTSSNNLSTFNVTNAGNISVNTAISATTQAGPIDAARSRNSEFLYILNSGSHSISGYSIANDGSLGNIQTSTGLPVGAVGLVAK